MLSPAQIERLSGPIADALRVIGYRPGLVQRDYQYVDLFSTQAKVETMSLGVFGQEPFDYRSACVGFSLGDGPAYGSENIQKMRAFGAPHVFFVTAKATQRWIVRESGGELVEEFATRELANRIEKNAALWGPAAVMRAKSNFAAPGPSQIDFVDLGLLPALDLEAGKKIDRMVTSVLHRVDIQCKTSKSEFDVHAIFNVLFRFLAAKLLHDRDIHTTPKIDFANPLATLRGVDNHYKASVSVSDRTVPDDLLPIISDEIARSFSFRNISVDTLTYVYENTFVSPASRRKLGIHSTPAYVADYVLSQIPLEELPRDQWTFLDPTCGHGIFLIAAMRRMRALLPPEWGAA